MKHTIQILTLIFWTSLLHAQGIHIPIINYTICDHHINTSEYKNLNTYKPLLDGFFVNNNLIGIFLHDRSKLGIEVDKYEVESDQRRIYGTDINGYIGDELIVSWEKGNTSFTVRWNDYSGEWYTLMEFFLKGEVDACLFTDPYYTPLPSHVFEASKVIVTVNGDITMFPNPEQYIKVKEIDNDQYVVGYSDYPKNMFHDVEVKYSSGVEGEDGNAFLYKIDGLNFAFKGLTSVTASEKLNDMARGKTGHILFFIDEKNYFAYFFETKVSDHEVKSVRPDDINTAKYDVGFDPFIAQLISDAEFRTAPSDSSKVFKLLTKGAQIYVYSKETINDYYKVIDITSSDIGWIQKEKVMFIQDVEFSESGAFQSTGYSESFDSQVLIRNKSMYSIKLVVGDTIFALIPNSSKTVQIKPETKYFIATAPGVMPASGYQEFKSYNSYEWEFWVSTISN